MYEFAHLYRWNPTRDGEDDTEENEEVGKLESL